MLAYPLFPLPVVLFPGALMPLHIFEPRYRALLADCAEGNHRFALVESAADGSPVPGSVGTVARIRAIQPLPDGRSNIVISGEQRVTLVDFHQGEKPYLIGRVTPLEDLEDVQTASPAELDGLRSLAARYAAALAVVEEVERDLDLAEDPATGTFQVAALLDWDLPTKQAFLRIRSPRERVVRLLVAMPALIAEVERRAKVHRTASTNGSGHVH